MHALLIQLREQYMAASTDCGNRFHLRRLGAVIPMARRAVRSRKIALLQRCPMDAGLVVLKLIGRDLVLRHVLGVGVTPAARFWKTHFRHRRLSIFDCADIVDAVAIDTGRDVLVTGRESLAVDAGLVELELIDALLWAKSPHEFGFAVAIGAKLGDRCALWLADESLRFRHGDGGIVAGRIAAMAVRAA